MAYSDAESLADFVLGQLARLEIFFHKPVVELRGSFDELSPEFVGLLLELRRNLKVLAGSVLILEMIVLHLEDIHESVERRSHVHRELHDYRLLPECLLESVEDVLPVRLLPVKLVDAEDYRHIVLVRIAGENLGSDLNALLRVGNQNGRVAHPECRDRSSDEIVRAGSVDDVELRVHELCVERGRVD